MKAIKFHKDLVPLVLSGYKSSTWRLFDEKNLSPGDDIELREFSVDAPFAHAKISKVIVKQFKDLTSEDKIGHEEYTNDEEMYKTYSGYYKTNVGPESEVKIIWFELQ